MLARITRALTIIIILANSGWSPAGAAVAARGTSVIQPRDSEAPAGRLVRRRRRQRQGRVRR
ncbi:MAG: hypothetical protein ACRDG4_01385 [Chloroflexota bacterium]